MNWLLGIETSYSPYGIVIGKDGKVFFDSTQQAEFAESRDVALMTKEGLKTVGITLQDLKKIIVNVGPGGTSSVRTGVAFANSLSYSLKIPVCPVNFFELIGIEVWKKYQMPVLCTMKSTKNNIYGGLFAGGKVVSMKYGFFAETITNIVGDYPKIAVVGFHREKIAEFLTNKEVIDTKIKLAQSKFLIEESSQFENRALLYPQIATPITDQSSIFYNHLATNF